MPWRVRLPLAAVALTVVLATGASAADAAFTARGSVEQVYATGLAPGVKAALVNRNGKKVATKRPDAQGGLLFRNVKPGGGYRVRQAGASSDPLTVLTARPEPSSTDVYNQAIQIGRAHV